MSTSSTSGLEFLPRPYPYQREPFRVNEGEDVPYRDVFFSVPAYALLLDKRLFTSSDSHPVGSPIKLYINKDSATFITLEPRLDGIGYTSGTPHYSDVILDLRNLLEDVCSLHASDSDHSNDQFFRCHMARNRSTYDLINTKASGITDAEYVHSSPSNTVPIAPSSLNQYPIELGALQFQDVDMDEVMWQPFIRPSKLARAIIDSIPVEPIFPAVLKNDGSFPSQSAQDVIKYDEAGYGAIASGGMLITGDVLRPGTSIKLMTSSGQIAAPEGNFLSAVDAKSYPAGEALCDYYGDPDYFPTVSGRQALYSRPIGLPQDSVSLLDVSKQSEPSGCIVQTYPGNYTGSSGVDLNGVAHDGVHTTDKLIYNLRDMQPGQIAVGRSPINGKRVFGHFSAEEASSLGITAPGVFSYNKGDTIYMFGGITDPLVGSVPSNTSTVEWGTTGKDISPVSWSTFNTTSLGPRLSPFTNAQSTTFYPSDQVSVDAGSPWIKLYTPFGKVDRVVFPGTDRAGGGELKEEVIESVTHIYNQNPDGSLEELQNSPEITQQVIKYWDNTYSVQNIFSNFFNFRPDNGLVNVNGKAYIQWTQRSGPAFFTPRFNRFASFGATSTITIPETTYNIVTVAIGFFPNWAIRVYVTTNNQVTIPDEIEVIVEDEIISIPSGTLVIEDADVSAYGCPVWDPDKNINYIYASTFDERYYFCRMNTDFEIISAIEVDAEDTIFTGKTALLSL